MSVTISFLEIIYFIYVLPHFLRKRMQNLHKSHCNPVWSGRMHKYACSRCWRFGASFQVAGKRWGMQKWPAHVDSPPTSDGVAFSSVLFKLSFFFQKTWHVIKLPLPIMSSHLTATSGRLVLKNRYLLSFDWRKCWTQSASLFWQKWITIFSHEFFNTTLMC